MLQAGKEGRELLFLFLNIWDMIRYYNGGSHIGNLVDKEGEVQEKDSKCQFIYKQLFATQGNKKMDCLCSSFSPHPVLDPKGLHLVPVQRVSSVTAEQTADFAHKGLCSVLCGQTWAL